MLGNGLHAVPKGKLAIIVTYLEMHTRADIRNVPLPNGVTFHQMTPTLDWYRDVFTRVGSLDWLWYGRIKMADAQLLEIFKNPKIHFFTLRLDGKDEALLELDFQEENTCEIAYFGLTQTLIGTGAGRYLMSQAITRAWDAGISRMHLNTCTHDSPQALDFYIRSGFVPYKRAVEIDDDPRLTGILPKTATPRIPTI